MILFIRSSLLEQVTVALAVAFAGLPFIMTGAYHLHMVHLITQKEDIS